MKVSAFLDAIKGLIVNTIESSHSLKSTAKLQACFKLKIEHENLVRNNRKNTPLETGATLTSQKGGIKSFRFVVPF